MKILFVEKKNIVNDKIQIIQKSDINHLKNVRRMKIDDLLNVSDGIFLYETKICEIKFDKIILLITDKKILKKTNEVEIDAAIALIKKDKFNLQLQKLCELGINKIYPLVLNRCVVKLDKNSYKDKWTAIVLETLKQCGGQTLMKIDKVLYLQDLDFKSYDLAVVAYEDEKKNKLKEVLENINKEKIKKILFVIGPEGGFENKEIKYMISENVKIVTLGKRILRAETAAITLGGILKYEFS